MESKPGTYALILASSADHPVQIGRLGQLHVKPGFYVYVGSAFGPGGVLARVAHHRQRVAQPHWHIDYLRVVVPLTEIWYAYDPLRREHQWAEALQQLRGASAPLQRFGASDCTCASHLYFFTTRPSWHTLHRMMRQVCRDPTSIYCQQLVP